jgi:hypothetical protein
LELGKEYILRRVLCVVRANCVWRISIYQELMKLYREADIISEISKERLKCVGHVESVPEGRTTMNVFKRVTSKQKGLSESQERDGYTIESMEQRPS